MSDIANIKSTISHEEIENFNNMLETVGTLNLSERDLFKYGYDFNEIKRIEEKNKNDFIQIFDASIKPPECFVFDKDCKYNNISFEEILKLPLHEYDKTLKILQDSFKIDNNVNTKVPINCDLLMNELIQVLTPHNSEKFCNSLFDFIEIYCTSKDNICNSDHGLISTSRSLELIKKMPFKERSKTIENFSTFIKLFSPSIKPYTDLVKFLNETILTLLVDEWDNAFKIINNFSNQKSFNIEDLYGYYKNEISSKLLNKGDNTLKKSRNLDSNFSTSQYNEHNNTSNDFKCVTEYLNTFINNINYFKILDKYRNKIYEYEKLRKSIETDMNFDISSANSLQMAITTNIKSFRFINNNYDDGYKNKIQGLIINLNKIFSKDKYQDAKKYQSAIEYLLCSNIYDDSIYSVIFEPKILIDIALKNLRILNHFLIKKKHKDDFENKIFVKEPKSVVFKLLNDQSQSEKTTLETPQIKFPLPPGK